MRPSGDPTLACALIVGVEQCGIFADDPLRGPIRDAIEWFDWFKARGVPDDRIAMFLSPKPDSRPLVDDWRSRRGRAIEKDATETDWRQFISIALPTYAKNVRNGTLFIVWSGHGLIDLRGHGRTRRLFYADSTIRLALNLELVSLMKALRIRELSGFAQQIMVVDACANYAIGLTRDDALLGPTDFPLRAPDPLIQQHVLLATAPGQLAQVDAGSQSRESVARFSRRMRDALSSGNAADATWPDFQAAFNVVRSTFEREDRRQIPVDWCSGVPDDTLPDTGRLPLADVTASQLAAALQVVSDDAMLQAAFYAALRPAQLTDAHYAAAGTGLVAMVTLLQQSTLQPGSLPPLMRWAIQIQGRLVHRRDAQLRAGLAAVEPPPSLIAWLHAAGESAAQSAYLQTVVSSADEAATPAPCHLLLLEEGDGSPGCASELHGFVFGGAPLRTVSLDDDSELLSVQPDGSGRAVGLKILLDRAVRAAEGELLIPSPTIVIEWALPAERIDANIEDTPVGLPGRERRLGTRHLVVRRMMERLVALGSGHVVSEISAWQQAARDLRQRLGTQGLRIVWLDPQVIRDTGLAAQLGAAPQASCIGLARTPATAALDQALKWALFDDALPFACWNDGDWIEGELDCLDKDLRDGASESPLVLAQRLRARQWGGRPHPGSRLRLLWDDPLHDPYATRLGAVPRSL